MTREQVVLNALRSAMRQPFADPVRVLGVELPRHMARTFERALSRDLKRNPVENTAGRDANRLASAGSVSSFHHGGQ